MSREKCGVEFCHSTRTAPRIRQKVGNGVSYDTRSLCLPCCVRDTVWSWFIYLFINKSMFFTNHNASHNKQLSLSIGFVEYKGFIEFIASMIKYFVHTIWIVVKKILYLFFFILKFYHVRFGNWTYNHHQVKHYPFTLLELQFQLWYYEILLEGQSYFNLVHNTSTMRLSGS